jgi:hypothetical protein
LIVKKPETEKEKPGLSGSRGKAVFFNDYIYNDDGKIFIFIRNSVFIILRQ